MVFPETNTPYARADRSGNNKDNVGARRHHLETSNPTRIRCSKGKVSNYPTRGGASGARTSKAGRSRVYSDRNTVNLR